MYLPPLAELLDRLTIAQIKLNLLDEGQADFENEINSLKHDVELLMQNLGISPGGEFVHLVVMLAQINLHIWHNKDLMQVNLDDDAKYLALLKLSHQLNGIRNRIKNRFLEIEGISDKSHVRSNVETDGLPWSL
jgi:hypothetical protein